MRIRFEPNRHDGKRTKVVWPKDGGDKLAGPCFNRTLDTEGEARQFARLVEEHGGFPPYRVLLSHGLAKHHRKIDSLVILMIQDTVNSEMHPMAAKVSIRKILKDF